MQFHWFIFFSFHSVIGTLKQGHTLSIMSFHAFAMMLSISIRESCHSIRLVKSRQFYLCWRSYSNVYPNVVKQKTKNNNDTALHCYSLSSRASMNQEIKKCYISSGEKCWCTFSADKNRWYPVHIAAFCNLPIDIIY